MLFIIIFLVALVAIFIWQSNVFNKNLKKRMTPKEFALSQIAPYFNDPSLCGVDKNGNCVYLTQDGKMCVLGKNLINPEKYDGSAIKILTIHDEHILKPESRGYLTTQQWQYLQVIHDNISHRDEILQAVKRLDLFTYEELVDYANNLKK